MMRPTVKFFFQPGAVGLYEVGSYNVLLGVYVVIFPIRAAL